MTRLRHDAAHNDRHGRKKHRELMLPRRWRIVPPSGVPRERGWRRSALRNRSRNDIISHHISTTASHRGRKFVRTVRRISAFSLDRELTHPVENFLEFFDPPARIRLYVKSLNKPRRERFAEPVARATGEITTNFISLCSVIPRIRELRLIKGTKSRTAYFRDEPDKCGRKEKGGKRLCNSMELEQR